MSQKNSNETAGEHTDEQKAESELQSLRDKAEEHDVDFVDLDQVQEDQDLGEAVEQRSEQEKKQFEWSEGLDDFKQTVSDAASGDGDAKGDLYAAPRKTWEFIKNNPSISDYFWDAIFPLGITVVGIVLLLVTSALSTSSKAYEALTSPTRYADMFLVALIFLVFVLSALIITKSVSNDYNSLLSRAMRVVRRTVVFSLLIPTSIVFGWITYYLATGDGATIATSPAWVENTLTNLPLLDAYWQNSPFGLSVRDTAIMMVVLGALSSAFYVTKIFKIFVISVTADFKLEELVQDDSEEGAQVPSVETYLESGLPSGVNIRKRTQSVDTDEGDGASIDVKLNSIRNNVEEMFKTHREYQLEPYPGYVEEQRYWVNRPFAFIAILYNERESERKYYVVEPPMTDEDKIIYEEFEESRLPPALLNEEVDETLERDDEREKKVAKIRDKMYEIAEMYRIPVDSKTFKRVFYYIVRNRVDYGKIDPIIRDDLVEDISCNGENDWFVFVFHRDYKDLQCNLTFDTDELRNFVIRMANLSGKSINIAEPLCDATLPNGARAQFALGTEVTDHGSAFTIRLFQDEPFTPVNLISTGTFSVEQMAYLWLAIQYDNSLIFAGGTASGKTTSMNAVSLFIPPKSKVITIEDTREVELPHENWLASVTRESFGADGQENIKEYQLLEAALRQRPEYLIVGEIRGEEAKTLFQAMSTGHTTYSTMHADDVASALNRLQNPPIDVPKEIISSLDIFCIQNQVRIKEDGERKNVRRNETITEVESVTENDIQGKTAFRYDPEYDEFQPDIQESQILKNIAQNRGESFQDVMDELERRQEVLSFLADKEINDFERATTVIQTYMTNPEKVMEQINSGEMNFEALRGTDKYELRKGDEDTEKVLRGDV